MRPLGTVRDRDVQLDAVTSFLVLSLLVVSALLVTWLAAVAPLTIAGILSSVVVRVLLAIFVIALLVYLVDERRRIRARMRAAMADLQQAHEAATAMCNRLMLANQSAEILADKGVVEGLREVLQHTADQLGADAVAMVDNGISALCIREGVDEAEASRALMHVALKALNRQQPQYVEPTGAVKGYSLAVPLRFEGELQSVLCAWGKGDQLTSDQLEGLSILGRLLEVSIERESLLEESTRLLEGTLHVLQYLVAEKRPDYARHAKGVADLACGVGRALGLQRVALVDLRLAGMLHDIGMMEVAQGLAPNDDPLSVDERSVLEHHARAGAETAAIANFDESVCEAIRTHHERWDGLGYPDGLRGEAIPLSGRILAVCEAFDSMTHLTYHGEPLDREEAIAELTSGAGSLYDPACVRALIDVVRAAPPTLVRFDRVSTPEAATSSRAPSAPAESPDAASTRKGRLEPARGSRKRPFGVGD